MYRNTISAFVVFVMLVLLLSGCGVPVEPGVYVKQADQREYLDLSESGKYTHHHDIAGYDFDFSRTYFDFSGTYTVMEKHVVLEDENSDHKEKWKIDGDNLRNPDGELYLQM